MNGVRQSWIRALTPAAFWAEAHDFFHVPTWFRQVGRCHKAPSCPVPVTIPHPDSLTDQLQHVLYRHFKPLKDRLDIEFRAEAFNVFNHTQFRITDPANPGNTGNSVINCYGSQSELNSAGASGCLQGNSFLHPVDAHNPRILQFAVKGTF